MINVDGQLFPDDSIAKVIPDPNSHGRYEALVHGVTLRGVREITRVEVLPARDDLHVVRVFEAESEFFAGDTPCLVTRYVTADEPCLGLRVEVSLVDSERCSVRPIVAGNRGPKEVARFFYDRNTGQVWDDNEWYSDMTALKRVYPPDDVECTLEAKKAKEQAAEQRAREDENRIYAGRV